MATYYNPPRQRGYSFQALIQGDQERDRDDRLHLDSGEHSIYVFPNPPSAPPSPSSSIFSAPIDIISSGSSSLSPHSRSRPRTRPHTTSFIAHTSSSRSQSLGQTDYDIRSGRGSSFSRASQLSRTSREREGEPDLDVEVWDWTASTPLDGSDGSWVLEEEVERASRWDIALHADRGPQRTSALQASAGGALDRATLRHAMRLRTRTQSNISTNTSLGSVRPLYPSVSVHPVSPQPRIHLPLLSFFAALLSLNLDDPALRLLTQATPADTESILFPGHTVTLLVTETGADTSSSADKGADKADSNADLDAESRAGLHGLQNLLSSCDDSNTALRSLRAGLAISSAVPLEFGMPGVQGLVGLWRAACEVCARSGQAWREAWRGV